MIASIQAVHNAVRAHFADQLPAGGLLAANVEWDNAEFAQPDNTLWCRFRVAVSDKQTIEFGAAKTARGVGMAVASIFMPLGQGDGTALTVATAIEAAFTDVTVADVRYRQPYTKSIGRNEDNTYWQVDVICPFWFYEQG